MTAKRERITNEDLAGALDEQFCMLAEVQAGQRAHALELAQLRRYILKQAGTIDRLLKERQTLLEGLGWQHLRAMGFPVRAEPPPYETGGAKAGGGALRL